jgi:amino acid transporter
MIFTSPRIYRATAQDSSKLKFLTGSQSNNQSGSGHGWWRALLLQMIVTIAFITAFSSNRGIENITAATAPYFWLFLALTVLSLIVNRVRYANQFSGYRVPLYPVTPIVFICSCAFMIYQAWTYLLGQGLLFSTILIGGWVLLGVGLSFFLDD